MAFEVGVRHCFAGEFGGASGAGGAMYLLIINFIAIGFAAPTVGALNDYVFHDANAVGKSLMIVNVVTSGIAAFLLYRGLKPS